MDRRREGSVPVAEKDGHVAIRGREGNLMSCVGDDEIIDTVTIDIADRDRRWDVSDLVEGWLGEVPPAVAEVDRDVPGLSRDGQVRRVVTVEITHNQTAHRSGRWDGRGFRERAVPVSSIDEQAAINSVVGPPPVGDDHVAVPVPIEITGPGPHGLVSVTLNNLCLSARPVRLPRYYA